MDRLIATNSVPFANADTAPATGTAQYATDGNPVTNTPATIFPAYAWNMLQDEIYNVIISAGLTPNRNSWNQLLTAIQTMLQGSTTNVAVDTGAANAYVVAFTPALAAPVPWVPFWFKVKTTNTGASTLNATGTVEPLVGGAHLALQGGELVANGAALVYWNPTLASGSGSYVLMFCSGAPDQIAPATASQHAVQFGQVAGVVGQTRNLKASLTSAGTSIAYTADEIVVESALGGLRYCLANFSQTLNGATTGLGGLDTGSLAASSYYAIYAAITSSGTQGIFAQLEPSGGATSVYGGSHLPSTVIATALIGVWPTNSSSQFVAGNQFDRSLGIANAVALSTSTIQSSWATLSISTIVPKSAKRLRGSILCSSNAASNVSLAIAESSAGVGLQQTGSSGGSSNTGSSCAFSNFNLSVAQTIYWQSLASAGTPSFVIEISGYDF